MANLKISELTQRTPDGTEFVEVIIPPFTPGTNRKVLLQDAIDLATGGSGVQSVTGDGVDNTDPDNPVLTFPTPGDIGAQVALGFTPIQSSDVVGVQDLPISAVAMWPRVSNGCAALQQLEMATSLLNVMTLDFDQTTQEFCQFTTWLPRKWNNGTITAIFHWIATSGSGDVQWGISGRAYSNGDALTAAFGTAVTVTQTMSSTNSVQSTSATSAMTLAGSPADADFLAFEISRNPASDTLTADARLLGVTLFITTDAAKDA